jgi:CHAT domain-containing protein
VSDDATRELMVSFYKRLQAGEGATEALRQVQLEMLQGTMLSQRGQKRGLGIGTGGMETKKNWRHPFYWASFIQSGEWRSIRLPSSQLAAVYLLDNQSYAALK